VWQSIQVVSPQVCRLQKKAWAWIMAVPFRDWCSSTNPIAPCCCSSRSRRQQKKLEGALLCKRRTSIYGANESGKPNKLAQVVTFRLQFGLCLSRIQAEDYDEIFHSKSSKQIPRWYIKIRYDRFLSRPLKFINHYHLIIIRHSILFVIQWKRR